MVSVNDILVTIDIGIDNIVIIVWLHLHISRCMIGAVTNKPFDVSRILTAAEVLLTVARNACRVLEILTICLQGRRKRHKPKSKGEHDGELHVEVEDW